VIVQAIETAPIGRYGVDWDVVRAVLSRRAVTLRQTVPGTDYNFDSLVRQGSIINSHPKEMFEPYIPEIFLHYWVYRVMNKSAEATSREAAECLGAAL